MKRYRRTHSRFSLFALIVLAFGTQPWCGVRGAGVSGEQGYEARLGEALQITDVGKRLQRFWEVGNTLANAEISGALKLASDLPELRERMIFTEAVLTRWGELAPPEAFSHVAQLPESQLKLNVLRRVAMQYVRQDPSRAAEAVATMKPGVSRTDVLPVVGRLWAESDAPAAIAWAENLAKDFARRNALEAIRYAWVQHDPAGAADHVAQLPPGTTKTNLVGNLAFEWAKRDTPSAIQWAENVPGGSDKDEALLRVAESWANQEPEKAAAFVLETFRPGEVRSKAAAIVAWVWAKQQPRAALDWAWQTEDPEIRKRSAPKVFEAWAAKDSTEAGKWLTQLSPGPDRDEAILAYIGTAIQWTPDLAAEHALRIEDAHAQVRALRQSLRRWLEVDPASARRWIRESNLPPELEGFSSKYLSVKALTQ